MRTIVLASRKGGAGKTTLSGHLAVEAERSGAGPVAVIDMDPMGGLSNWWNARANEAPAFARVGEGGLRSLLSELEQKGINRVVIDTPPFASTEVAGVVREANLVVVPVVPSPHDLWAIGDTISLVEGERKPLVFVVNNAGAGRLAGEVAIALSQHGTVAPIKICTRQDFRSAMVKGLTVGEVSRSSKSAAEVSQLWDYLQARLERTEMMYGAVA
jgi:chromosome partitioning protein